MGHKSSVLKLATMTLKSSIDTPVKSYISYLVAVLVNASECILSYTDPTLAAF